MVYEEANVNLRAAQLPSVDAKKSGRIERNQNMNYKNKDLIKKKLEEYRKIAERGKEKAKRYTEEQMREDIKKYELDKEFGIYIVDESEFKYPDAADSGYLIKKKDGTFDVIITGERAIPTSSLTVNTINEAMSHLVSGLKYEKSKAEYFRNGR